MALLWMDGFDHYGEGSDGLDNMVRNVWTSANGVFSTDIKHTGDYSFQIGTGLSRNCGIDRKLTSNTTSPNYFYYDFGIGFWLYVDQLPAVESDLIRLTDYYDGQLCKFVVTPEGYIKFISENPEVTQGTSIIPITTGKWIHFEAFVKSYWQINIYPEPFKLDCELRLNEVRVLKLDGVTSSMGDLNKVKLYGWDFNIYVDDLFTWDKEGPVNTNFIGSKRISTIPLTANAPITTEILNDWLPVGTDQAYEAINEIPPDMDTSYMYSKADENPDADNQFVFQPLNETFGGTIYGYQNYTLAKGVSNLQVSLNNKYEQVVPGNYNPWHEAFFTYYDSYGEGILYNYTTEILDDYGYPTPRQMEYKWQCPLYVNRVAIVCIGGGGGNSTSGGIAGWTTYPDGPDDVRSLYTVGGAGGNLAYTNYVEVNPGEIYTIRAGGGGYGYMTWLDEGDSPYNYEHHQSFWIEIDTTGAPDPFPVVGDDIFCVDVPTSTYIAGARIKGIYGNKLELSAPWNPYFNSYRYYWPIGSQLRTHSGYQIVGTIATPTTSFPDYINHFVPPTATVKEPFGPNGFVEATPLDGSPAWPNLIGAYQQSLVGTKGGTSYVKDFFDNTLCLANGGYAGAREPVSSPDLSYTDVGDFIGYGGYGGGVYGHNSEYESSSGGPGGGGGGGGGYSYRDQDNVLHISYGGDGGGTTGNDSVATQYQPTSGTLGAGGGGGASLMPTEFYSRYEYVPGEWNEPFTWSYPHNFILGTGGGGATPYGLDKDGGKGKNGGADQLTYAIPGYNGGTNQQGTYRNYYLGDSQGEAGRYYGGGAGSGFGDYLASPGTGCVRIIWPGPITYTTRAFPDTNVESLSLISETVANYNAIESPTDYLYYSQSYDHSPITNTYFTVQEFNDNYLRIKAGIAYDPLYPNPDDELRVTESVNLVLTDLFEVSGDPSGTRSYKNVVYPSNKETLKLIKVTN